jgi:pyruvate dehydrogenase E2 component (dihydrolipoamide acetyltransferase)
MAMMEVNVPDIGDFDEVAVIELLVKVGDKVRAEQSLITVESDKASMEIPSSHAGVVTELMVKLGDKVKQGSLIVKLDATEVAGAAPVAAAALSAVAAPASAASASAASSVVAAPAPVAPVTAVPVVSTPVSAAVVAVSVAVAPLTAPAHQPTVAPSGDLPHASPSVRKFAR